MPIRVPVRIRAGGNMHWWRRQDLANICRCMKMSGDTFFSIQRDLCMLEHIPELLDSGIDSFKIEGSDESSAVRGHRGRTYRKSH